MLDFGPGGLAGWAEEDRVISRPRSSYRLVQPAIPSRSGGWTCFAIEKGGLDQVPTVVVFHSRNCITRLRYGRFAVRAKVKPLDFVAAVVVAGTITGVASLWRVALPAGSKNDISTVLPRALKEARKRA